MIDRILSVAALCVLCACGDANAEHRAMAAAVIEHANSQHLQDASSEDFAAVRHMPSGLICVLPNDGAFDLEEFPPTAHNEGVYCSSASAGVTETYVAVHYGEVLTLDQAFAEALAQAIAPTRPQAWDGEPSSTDAEQVDGLLESRVGRFLGAMDGEQRYLRLAMTTKDGWFVQQIVSAPLERAQNVETQSGANWRRVVAALSQGGDQH